MEYREFAKLFSERAGVAGEAEARAVLADIAAALSHLLVDGHSVAVAGFGNFEPMVSPSRVADGKLWPPKIEAVFTPGTRLRKAAASQQQ